MLNLLNKKNPDLQILDIFDPSFSKFGRILNFDNYREAATYIESFTEIPINDNSYVADDVNFKSFLTETSPFSNLFGGIELQYGYVNGHNSYLNALEYHKTSEINIAASPMVIMVGHASNIKDNQFSTKDLSIFFVPKYTAFELYPLTLHFSPCEVSKKGFKCGVILPKGTNVNFETAKYIDSLEDKLLFKTNKWLIAHKDNEKLNNTSAHIGIIGPNYKIKY